MKSSILGARLPTALPQDLQDRLLVKNTSFMEVAIPIQGVSSRIKRRLRRKIASRLSSNSNSRIDPSHPIKRFFIQPAIEILSTKAPKINTWPAFILKLGSLSNNKNRQIQDLRRLVAIQPFIFSCLIKLAYLHNILNMSSQHSSGDHVTNKTDYSNIFDGGKSKRGPLYQSQPNQVEQKRSQEQYNQEQALKKDFGDSSSLGNQTFENFKAQRNIQDKNDYDQMAIPAKPVVVPPIQTNFIGSTKVEPTTMTNSIFFISTK